MEQAEWIRLYNTIISSFKRGKLSYIDAVAALEAQCSFSPKEAEEVISTASTNKAFPANGMFVVPPILDCHDYKLATPRQYAAAFE